MGGETKEGVNAKSFSEWVMLMQEFLAFPLIQMLCKELAQGPKLMHLYSLQPSAWTNEQLGNFKQSSLSFFSQGKCAHKNTAFQLIKPVCTYSPPPSPFFLPFSPALHAPREIKQLRTEYKFTLTPLMSFTPLIVSVRKMSSLFLVKLWFWCIRWIWFCTLTLWPRRWLTAENVQKTLIEEGNKIRVEGDRTKTAKLFKKKLMFSESCTVRIHIHLWQVLPVLWQEIKCPIYSATVHLSSIHKSQPTFIKTDFCSECWLKTMLCHTSLFQLLTS